MIKDKNRYALNKSAEGKYLGLLSSFIDKLDNYTEEDIDNKDNSEFTLELSDTELNPYTLKSLLEMFGYEEGDLDINGWQWDYWWEMENENAKTDLTRKLVIWGTGITFELKLSNDEFI